MEKRLSSAAWEAPACGLVPATRPSCPSRQHGSLSSRPPALAVSGGPSRHGGPRPTQAGGRSRARRSLQIMSRSWCWRLWTSVDSGRRGGQSGGPGDTPGCGPSLHSQGRCGSTSTFLFWLWDRTMGPPHPPSPSSSSLSGVRRHHPSHPPLTRPRSSPLRTLHGAPPHALPPRAHHPCPPAPEPPQRQPGLRASNQPAGGLECHKVGTRSGGWGVQAQDSRLDKGMAEPTCTRARFYKDNELMDDL